MCALTKDILNVPISSLDYDQTSLQIIDWAKKHESRTVGVCNVHSVTTAGWNPELKKALLSNDLNTPDGVPLVWTLKTLGATRASRVYGPTLMLYLLAYARYENLRIAFYGGHPDRLEKLVSNLKNQFEGLNVVEAISPPFRKLTEAEEHDHLQRLREARPHLIFVGLGCPKQEIWMAKHRDQVPAVWIGVGAAFDFHADAVPQAPSAIQRLGMEWAFRLYQEPRRLAKRYITTNPVFLLRVASQITTSALRKSWGAIAAGLIPDNTATNA